MRQTQSLDGFPGVHSPPCSRAPLQRQSRMRHLPLELEIASARVVRASRTKIEGPQVQSAKQTVQVTSSPHSPLALQQASQMPARICLIIMFSKAKHEHPAILLGLLEGVAVVSNNTKHKQRQRTCPSHTAASTQQFFQQTFGMAVINLQPLGLGMQIRARGQVE
jgi:hypothetical protein